MAELSLADRVDDAILCASYRLARVRGQTIRGSVADFRATCVEKAALDPDEIWKLRLDRAAALLMREDRELRTMAVKALERER